MNLFTKTLYQKRILALGWFIGITAITVLTLSFFHTLSQGDLGKSFSSLPPALQKIAGDAASFTTVKGYVAQQIFALRVPLLCIIMSIIVFTGIGAGEEEKGLLETHISLPLSRTSILLQKWAAGVLTVLLATIGSGVGVVLGLALIGEHYQLGLLAQQVVNAFVVALDFGLVSYTIAAVTGRRGLAVGAASAFAFLSYLINSLASSVSSLASVDKLTLFHYYQTSPFKLVNLLGLVVVAVVLTLISCVGFNRRDIRAH